MVKIQEGINKKLIRLIIKLANRNSAGNNKEKIELKAESGKKKKRFL